MAGVTMLIGGALVLLGVASYGMTEAKSVTALIPAFFGLPIALLGYLSRNDNLRKHVMHAAALLGLLGLLGSALMGLRGLPGLLAGTAERPVATVTQLLMAGLCGLFVGLCVNSFVQARRARKQGPTSEQGA